MLKSMLFKQHLNFENDIEMSSCYIYVQIVIHVYDQNFKKYITPYSDVTSTVTRQYRREIYLDQVCFNRLSPYIYLRFCSKTWRPKHLFCLHGLFYFRSNKNYVTSFRRLCRGLFVTARYDRKSVISELSCEAPRC